MAYQVLEFFVDLQDKNHPYNAGDSFPRKGAKVSAERIAYLSGSDNLRGKPVIKKVAPKKKAKPEAQKEE